MLVMIQPQDLIYDQVFRFYEPKQSVSRTTIPNFIPPRDGIDQPRLAECVIRCSNPAVAIGCTAGNELEATMMNKAALSVQQAVIYIYADGDGKKRCTELLGAARIEVHACDAVAI